SQRRVHSGRSFYPLDVQAGEDECKENCPSPIRNAGSKYVRLLAAPDDADHGVKHVIHDHAPASDIAESGINLLPDVGECRAGTGIGTRHLAIADRGEEHGDHGDEDCGDDVAAAAVAEHAEHRHGRYGLNYDYAVKNQIPQRERAAQAWGSRQRNAGSGFHGCAYWIMRGAKVSIL